MTASQALRRLHEEATREAKTIGDTLLRTDARDAAVWLLPELAALVEVMEAQAAAHRAAGGGTCPWAATTYCLGCRALAALTARLESA